MDEETKKEPEQEVIPVVTEPVPEEVVEPARQEEVPVEEPKIEQPEEVKEEVKEQINEVVERNIRNRDELSLQKFFDDMNDLGKQVNSSNIIKPTFHYGDTSVTNYLLWLLLGEMMILNDNMMEAE